MKALIYSGILLLTLSPLGCQASLCYVKQGKADCIVRAGEKMALKQSYSPCDEVTVICPGATLCYTNLQSGISCLESGAVLEDADTDGAATIDIAARSSRRDDASFLQVLRDIFFPQAVTHLGMKRLNTYEELAGFPDGYVLMPEQALVFSSHDKGHARIESFALWRAHEEQAILKLDRPGASVRIPAALLMPEQQYRWRALANGDEFGGGFTIESQAYQQEFEQALNQALQHSDSANVSRHIVRAALAKKYGYSFDYLQSVQMARNEINKRDQP
ncbi:hypothetical protein Tel_07970 [Candidatus Tenderia electrophaga]|jgi:hypothetical protein|uniref:Uncharacterized protein n=1 Tax=Candidatus Tenderia electrophaga TaxID=1748243 RepID=A0A0S2TD82_9GAMM|nr:hypothetical protein Tel_07970 [Candidatus Tenderia electrophaga]